jgi:hypothetical protein
MLVQLVDVLGWCFQVVADFNPNNMKNGLYLIFFGRNIITTALFNELEIVILEFSLLYREEFGKWPLTSKISLRNRITLSKSGIQK